MKFKNSLHGSPGVHCLTGMSILGSTLLTEHISLLDSSQNQLMMEVNEGHKRSCPGEVCPPALTATSLPKLDPTQPTAAQQE